MQSLRKVVETAVWVISLAIGGGVDYMRAALTESKVGEQNGRLDAADVGIVHDFDGQGCLHKVHHVVQSQKCDWESNVVGSEHKDVDKVPDCEELYKE